jgi:hypothetical protein
MVTLLTDLYDCPDTYRYKTRHQKAVYLKDVALTLLGASTPDWLATSLPDDAFGGGFMSRFILVVKQYRDRSVAWPRDPDVGEKESLKKQIALFRKFYHGEVVPTKEARDWFINWYDNTLSKKQISSSEDPTAAFYERFGDTVIKVAIILNGASDPASREISLSCMRRAKDIVQFVHKRTFMAFNTIDITRFGKLHRNIIDYVRGERQVSRRDVLRRFGHRLNSSRELQEIEAVMLQADEIEVVTVPSKSGKGRPSIVYKLKTKGSK